MNEKVKRFILVFVAFTILVVWVSTIFARYRDKDLFTEQLGKVETELQSAIERNRELERTITDTDRIVSDLTNQLHAAKRTIGDLTETVAEFERTIASQTRIINELTKANTEANKSVERIRSIIESGEDIIDGLINYVQNEFD